jgi:hypothetical protein
MGALLHMSTMPGKWLMRCHLRYAGSLGRLGWEVGLRLRRSHLRGCWWR